MVTIKKICRKSERRSDKYTGSEWTCYLESELNFIQGVENLCNCIGEENIISIQFFLRELHIDTCVITYKN